jgi:hypothetical protein
MGSKTAVYFNKCCCYCLEAQGTTLLSVTRLLTDRNYRKFILKQVNDPILVKFWEEEYAQMAQNPRLLAESVSPIQNKVGRLYLLQLLEILLAKLNQLLTLEILWITKRYCLLI